uniref:Uncharacterized protein n=1 Tax=Myoviridae sp. ctqMr7 TaxID=2823552 RepID=A0A8S5LH90_9CAUD|nr:MAG TPA: hypothetical protein [Myoviridae sp. ctqMr7]
MDHITIGEIGGIIAFLSGLIGGIITLIKYAKNGMKEMLKGEFQGVNDQIAEIKEDVSEIRDIGHNNARNGKRNEILLMINTQPEKVDEIERSYEDYKALGGNGYIDSLIETWREEYGKKMIKERLKRKEKK